MSEPGYVFSCSRVCNADDVTDVRPVEIGVMDVIVKFDASKLNHVEKPNFFRELNDRIEEEELFCDEAIKVPEEKLDGVRPAFDQWDVPIEIYHVRQKEADDVA